MKLLQRLFEIGVDLPDVRGQRLAFRAANLHALQLVELKRRLRQVQDVVAPFEKRVQPGEESRVLKLPRILRRITRRSAFVLEVKRLERAEDVE